MTKYEQMIEKNKKAIRLLEDKLKIKDDTLESYERVIVNKDRYIQLLLMKIGEERSEFDDIVRFNFHDREAI